MFVYPFGKSRARLGLHYIVLGALPHIKDDITHLRPLIIVYWIKK